MTPPLPSVDLTSAEDLIPIGDEDQTEGMDLKTSFSDYARERSERLLLIQTASQIAGAALAHNMWSQEQHVVDISVSIAKRLIRQIDEDADSGSLHSSHVRL